MRFFILKKKAVSWYLCLKILSLKDVLILILILRHLAYEKRGKTQSETLLSLCFSCILRTTYDDYDMVTQLRQPVHCNILKRSITNRLETFAFLYLARTLSA